MKLNIIIADDEYFIRKKMIKMLRESLDFIGDIHEAENGEELWKLANTLDVNLIISDIRMPGMDGLEVLRRIKENDLNIKLIIVSGYNEFEYAKTAVKYAAFDYILKPITGEELLSGVKRAYQNIQNEKKSDYKHKLNLLLEHMHQERNITELFYSLDEKTYQPHLLQIYKKDIQEEIKSLFFFFKRSHCEYLWIKEDENTYTILFYKHIEDTNIMSNLMEFLERLYHDSFYFLVYAKLEQEASLCRIYQNLKEKLKLRYHYAHSQIIRLDTEMDYESILSTSVKNLIAKHYGDVDFSIEDIASHLDMNASYIGSIFKKENHISIIKYLNTVRLNKAQDLLKHSDKKIADIALSCGFNDVYYFSKKYKAFFGHSPSNER